MVKTRVTDGCVDGEDEEGRETNDGVLCLLCDNWDMCFVLCVREWVKFWGIKRGFETKY